MYITFKILGEVFTKLRLDIDTSKRKRALKGIESKSFLFFWFVYDNSRDINKNGTTVMYNNELNGTKSTCGIGVFPNEFRTFVRSTRRVSVEAKFVIFRWRPGAVFIRPLRTSPKRFYGSAAGWRGGRERERTQI